MKDRELVITRTFDAPRELVFEAWTNPEHIPQWLGPKGFTNTTREIDIRPGGVWRFIMNSPDGTGFNNKIVYTEIVKPERIAYIHNGDKENDPQEFQVTVTFAEQGNKTELTMRMVFGSVEAFDTAKKFGAVEGAHQSLDRLEALVTTLQAS